ncbi:MAG: hypothetical protein ABH803_03815 [Candidatus Micrarchaeota archaeon]
MNRMPENPLELLKKHSKDLHKHLKTLNEKEQTEFATRLEKKLGNISLSEIFLLPKNLENIKKNKQGKIEEIAENNLKVHDQKITEVLDNLQADKLKVHMTIPEKNPRVILKRELCEGQVELDPLAEGKFDITTTNQKTAEKLRKALAKHAKVDEEVETFDLTDHFFSFKPKKGKEDAIWNILVKHLKELY